MYRKPTYDMAQSQQLLCTVQSGKLCAAFCQTTIKKTTDHWGKWLRGQRRALLM